MIDTHIGKKVFFFGLGTLVEECFDELVNMVGRAPDFFCDNSSEKWGRVFNGIECVSPSILAEHSDNSIVVITVKKYEEIVEQLKRIGIQHTYLALYKRTYNAIGTIIKLPLEIHTLEKKKLILNSVQGKWAFISGASRGCGRVIANGLAQLGVNVIVHGRCVSNTDAIAQECASYGVKTRSVGANLEKADELTKMLKMIDQMVPRVDIVFNNAGISPNDSTQTIDQISSQFNLVFQVNTIAPILISYHFIPGMITRGFGRIINVTSSIQKRAGEMAYACSKAALDKFVHDYAPSLNGTGVMMSLVDPGWLQTDMGGIKALHPVESVLPGILLGALLNVDINGQWIAAQDYSGLSLIQAAEKATLLMTSTSQR